MTKPSVAGSDEMLLQSLGIEEDEEQVYRMLLVARTATAEEAAAALSLPPALAEALLQRAEAKGLASHSPERPRRYIPTRPDVAVEFLIQQQQVMIESARVAIPALQSLTSEVPKQSDDLELVEIITNRSALGRMLEQQQQSMQTEVFAFQRAPELYPDAHQKVVPKHLRIRSISDSTYISLPGRIELLGRLVELGEEARYAHTLPMKMIVWDRRIALVPLSIENQQGPALLVRGSSLLDALCALFDLMWERSTPIAAALFGKPPEVRSGPRLSKAAESLIPLLAAGLNDKVIAHQGDLSKTTLNRRIAELMQVFDARTRFQLGWRAALEAFPERVQRDETNG
jgi:sugar-specific transcriptional regulator TrmB